MLAYDNMVKSASDWVKLAFDVPFARAVVFGVPIGGAEFGSPKHSIFIKFY